MFSIALTGLSLMARFCSPFQSLLTSNQYLSYGWSKRSRIHRITDASVGAGHQTDIPSGFVIVTP